MSERTRRGLIFIALVILPLVAGLLITYQILSIPFPTDMQFQPAVGYQEGPRMLPPEDAVSVDGKSIILDTVPENPVPMDEVSLQRGKILYSIHCELCHGAEGDGDGPLREFYPDRAPSDLTAANITAQFDGALFRTVSEGLGDMPPLTENLSTRERWDVINYVRQLAE